MSLPIIDFSKLDLANPLHSETWESIKSQVKEAIEEFGCFEAITNKISPNHDFEIFKSLRDLFDLPVETKELIVNEDSTLSYSGPKPLVPLYEVVVVTDPTSVENIHNLSNLLWPKGNPSFSKAIQAITIEAAQLENLIRRSILEILLVEKYSDELANSMTSVIRMMKYEAPKCNGSNVGLLPHHDPNMITILYEDKVGGLEVETKDGEWIMWKPSQRSFKVIIGESFTAWANGRFKCAFHRVMMRGTTEARYSLGVFSTLKGGTLVKSPEELIDEEHPLCYKPFDYDQFRKFRDSGHFQQDIRSRGLYLPLKVYCGV